EGPGQFFQEYHNLLDATLHQLRGSGEIRLRFLETLHHDRDCGRECGTLPLLQENIPRDGDAFHLPGQGCREDSWRQPYENLDLTNQPNGLDGTQDPMVGRTRIRVEEKERAATRVGGSLQAGAVSSDATSYRRGARSQFPKHLHNRKRHLSFHHLLGSCTEL